MQSSYATSGVAGECDRSKRVTRNLAELTGQQKIIRVGGREYQAYPLTLDDQGELQAWIDQYSVDPFDVLAQQLAKRVWPQAVQEQMTKLAYEHAMRGKPLLGTVQAQALLASLEGRQMIFWLSIRKGDPSFSQDEAADLLRQLDTEAQEKIRAAADILGDDSPKATGADDILPSD